MNDIYREELMEHYKNPQNHGKLAKPDISISEVNTTCGDSINLQLSLKNGVISEVAFDGDACAVSTAASSLFTEAIKGKTLAEAKKISKDDLLAMLGVELTTSRVKCATLVLDTFQKVEHETTANTVSQKQVTRETNIAELVAKYPEVAEVLLDYGLHCVGCFANAFDSLEAGAKIHGYSDEEIDEMVARINEVIEFGE